MFDGENLGGVLDKRAFKKIIPFITKDNGDAANLDFLNGAKHVIQSFLRWRGGSKRTFIRLCVMRSLTKDITNC